MEEIQAFLEHVKGNTFCIVTAYARIPLYRLDDRHIVMIDSGLPRHFDDIMSVLTEHDLCPVAILTSHTHPDHIGNHAALRERFGAELYMTAYAAATRSEPMNAYASAIHRTGFRQLRQGGYRIFAPDHILDWNAPSVTVRGAEFQLLQLPGHEAEQLGFVTPDGVAYLSDTLLSPTLAQALRMPYCVCVELDLESKEKVGKLCCDRYILAHNGVYDSIEDIARANLESIQQKLDMLEALADEPVSMDELVRRYLVLTKSELDSHRKVVGIHYNVSGYICYLLDEGRLTMQIDDGMIKYVKAR